jgi:hypothetical protein
MSDSHYHSALLSLMDKGMSKEDAEQYLQIELLNIIKQNENNPLLQPNNFDIIRCKLAHKTQK